MHEMISIFINGRAQPVSPGTTVASALWQAGVSVFRRSVTGEGRGPLCGMGICFECRLTIDGVPHRLGCQTLCTAGMEVQTDAP